MKTSNLWLALIPFAAFAVAFGAGAIALWFIAKRTKVSQTETKYGKALHVESPIGTLDVHPQGKLDPRLARIPIYPGAMREDPVGAESVSELHYGSTTLQETSASYWTPDSAQGVWDFYRAQLPGWPQNLDGAQGKELILHQKDCVLLLRVSTDRDRTVVETCIKPPGYPHIFGTRS